MVQVFPPPDSIVNEIVQTLQKYEAAHPGSSCTVRRYNSGAVRVRIVDPAFRGMSKGDRHDHAVAALDELSDDTLAEISILLCLAPGESSLMNADFDESSPSHS
jgi:hypothetical protein